MSDNSKPAAGSAAPDNKDKKDKKDSLLPKEEVLVSC